MLLIGAGGLGSPASLYLAAAGVGTLGIVDADVVDDSNLQRQIVHSTERLGEPKVHSAKRTIEALNPDVDVKTYEERLTSENVERILGDGWDVIVDGADNFPTRYLVNDASVWHDIPVVHGSIYRFEGQVTVFNPARTARATAASSPRRRRRSSRRAAPRAACSACCPGIVGSLQANEALKLLLGIGESLQGRLLLLRRARHDVRRGRGQARSRPARSAASTPRSPSTSTTSSSAPGCVRDGGPDPADAAERGRRRARGRGEGETVREVLEDLVRSLPRARRRSSSRAASSRRS